MKGTPLSARLQQQVGACRWTYRAIVYAFVLATDRYPPFRLSE